jgi:hypothetical protein
MLRYKKMPRAWRGASFVSNLTLPTRHIFF